MTDENDWDYGDRGDRTRVSRKVHEPLQRLADAALKAIEATMVEEQVRALVIIEPDPPQAGARCAMGLAGYPGPADAVMTLLDNAAVIWASQRGSEEALNLIVTAFRDLCLRKRGRGAGAGPT